MVKRGRRRRYPHLDRRLRRLRGGGVSIHYFYRPLGLSAGRLPPPDDARFEMEYALRAQQFRDRNVSNPNARTLGELKTLLRSGSEWSAISKSQRASYSRAFEAIERRWPDDTPLRGVMDHPRMRPVILTWFHGHQAMPATANMHKAGLSRLLSFGVDRGLLERNLALGLRRLPGADHASVVWTPEQIQALSAASSPQIASAIALAYATAQRQADLLSLTWNDVTHDGVTFRPAKLQKRSNQRIFVPMYDELRQALELAPRGGITILATKDGRPWNIHTFRHEFKAACRSVGLPDALRFHDLRGSALKAFADAGCSELEIRAISGHSMKALPGALGRYIDPWRSLAQSAVEKRENANRTKVQTDGANPQRADSDSGL
jgi:integrase